MRKSKPGLRIIFLQSGDLYGRNTELSRWGKARQTDAQILNSVYHFAARQRAV